MDIFTQWGDTLSNAFSQLLQRFIEHVPSVLGAFLLLLLGWFAARVLRLLAMRAVSFIERGFARLPVGRETGGAKLPSTSVAVLGSIVFWVVLLVFLMAATQVLGLNAFTAWLERVVDYLPTLIAGALIVIAGFLVSRLAREIMQAAAVSMPEKQRQLLGKTTQAVIFSTALLVGADQIGIKITILVVIAATLAATLVGAVALSVSLGARNYVANLIGSHYLRHTYSVGQKIRVAGLEGKILDLTSTAVVIDTAEGRASLPAKVFNDEVIIVLTEGSAGG